MQKYSNIKNEKGQMRKFTNLYHKILSYIHPTHIPSEIETKKKVSYNLIAGWNICASCGNQINREETIIKLKNSWSKWTTHPIKWKNRKYYTFLTKIGGGILKGQHLKCLRCQTEHESVIWIRIAKICILIWI